MPWIRYLPIRVSFPIRIDQNHLGANFGGPIRKNKWFIFAGFEYNPTGQASSSAATIESPTAAGYAALAAAPGVSQTNLNVLKQYAVAPAVTAGAPNVTVAGVTVPTGVVQVTGRHLSITTTAC